MTDDGETWELTDTARQNYIMKELSRLKLRVEEVDKALFKTTQLVERAVDLLEEITPHYPVGTMK